MNYGKLAKAYVHKLAQEPITAENADDLLEPGEKLTPKRVEKANDAKAKLLESLGKRWKLDSE